MNTPSLNYLRFVHIGLFLLFGLIISAVTFLLLDVENKNQRKILVQNSLSALIDEKENQFQNYFLIEADMIDSIQVSINANYSDMDEAWYDEQARLIAAVMRIQPDIEDIRWYDSSGFERVHLENDEGVPYQFEQSDLSTTPNPEVLENLTALKIDEFHTSEIFLKREEGEIMLPYTPLAKVSKPLYRYGAVTGAIEITLNLKHFLRAETEAKGIDVYLLDESQNIVEHSYGANFKEDLRFEREIGFKNGLVKLTGFDGLQDGFHELGEDTYARIRTIRRIFPGGEPYQLLLIVNLTDNEALPGQSTDVTLQIFALVLLLSLPIAWLIGQLPIRLSKELLLANQRIEEQSMLVDRFVILLSLDKNQVITRVSSACLQALGYSKTEVIGQSLESLLNNRSNAEQFDPIIEAIREKQIWDGEVELQDINNESLCLFMHLSPQSDKNGTFLGYDIYCEDKTDHKKVSRMAITDALTKLHNRHYLKQVFQNELDRASRDKKSIVFILLDIDHFKKYNDHYGHVKGDEVLAAVAATIRETFKRSSDFTFRVGGEEFAVLTSNLSTQQVMERVEKLYKALGLLAIPHEKSPTEDHVTLSAGIVFVSPGNRISTTDLYACADKMLYLSKDKGRNRYHIDTQ